MVTRSVSAREIATSALTMGITAGLRSMMPLAMLALRRDQAPGGARWENWPVLKSGLGRGILVAAGAGELVADKLPATPSRLMPLPLLGRMTLGGVAGAAIGSEAPEAEPVLVGTIFGIIGGALGSYAGYYIRQAVVKKTGLPDLVIALGEDALAVALAAYATKPG